MSLRRPRDDDDKDDVDTSSKYASGTTDNESLHQSNLSINKKIRLSDSHPDSIVSHQPLQNDLAGAQEHQVVLTSFPADPLTQFQRTCAKFQQPTEIGFFSYDEERRLLLMDDKELKYYHPPTPVTSNLSSGYPDRFIMRPQNIENLDSLISCVRRVNDNQLDSSQSNDQAEGSSTTKTKHPSIRPQICTWRGIMTKLFCTPYVDDAWELRATLYKGILYIMEYETTERRRQAYGATARDKLMSYWGYRFESLFTIDKPPNDLSGPDDPCLHQRVDEAIVNTNIQFCSVVRTRLGTNEMVLGAEVDCMMSGELSLFQVHARKTYQVKRKNLPMLDTKPEPHRRQRTYAELKTNRIITNDRQRRTFQRFKLLRIYFQSWLAGIPKIVIGYRDDQGILQSVETLNTHEIPRMVRGTPESWDAVVCINFADALIERICACVRGWFEHRKRGSGQGAGDIDEVMRQVVFPIKCKGHRVVEVLEPIIGGPDVFVPKDAI
ncbi:Dom-3 Z [Blyttiomyces sp. JEL0837]|nr:Dom-3 Z [Blyttiomyces sp. JEL0837]